MNIMKFIRKTKFFTLIELIVVIVVLSILAAIVIPNISSFQEEAEETAILSDARSLQTSVDMYMLKNNGKTPTKETPTIGNPQTVEVYGLQPEFLRDLPKTKRAKFWLDHNNTVWASIVDAPEKVDYSAGKLTWETVEGAELYKVYKSEDSVTASVKSPKGIKFIDDIVPVTGLFQEKSVPTLIEGTYLVSAVDKFGFESAPTKVKSAYDGYKSPNKDFSIGNAILPTNSTPEKVEDMIPAGWIGIRTVEDLAKIGKVSDFPLSGNYILLNNLDLNISPYNIGEGWLPIGTETNSFTGNFNGNGHIIENLYINRPDMANVGLFGHTSGSIIEKVGIKNGNVIAQHNVGLLVGRAKDSSTVRESFATGKLDHPSAYGGGLVGMLMYSGTVENSYANVKMSTTRTGTVHHSGGLVGGVWDNSKIINSYSTSEVNYTYSTIGGLMGYNHYSTATNSYWDINVSKQNASKLGEGKTTLDMYKQSTYNSWDFTNIWTINEGVSYPKLKWESQ